MFLIMLNCPVFLCFPILLNWFSCAFLLWLQLSRFPIVVSYLVFLCFPIVVNYLVFLLWSTARLSCAK